MALAHGPTGRAGDGIDLQFDSRVQVKLYKSPLLAALDAQGRLELQAAHALRLAHPSLARILSAGFSRLGPFVVYRRVGTDTLRERLRRQARRHPAQVRRLSLQICMAHSYLHRRGLSHGGLHAGEF